MVGKLNVAAHATRSKRHGALAIRATVRKTLEMFFIKSSSDFAFGKTTTKSIYMVSAYNFSQDTFGYSSVQQANTWLSSNNSIGYCVKKRIWASAE